MVLALVSQTVTPSGALAARTLETKWQIVSIFSIWIDRKLDPMEQKRNEIPNHLLQVNRTCCPQSERFLYVFETERDHRTDDTWFFFPSAIHIFRHSTDFRVATSLLGSRCGLTLASVEGVQGRGASEWRRRNDSNGAEPSLRITIKRG